MQRDLLPNTYRDVNESPTPESNSEQMDVENGFYGSSVHPVNNNHIDSSRSHRITNRPLFKSIVQTNNNGTDSLIPQPLENQANSGNTFAQATGFDPKFSATIDADEAFARELQQQEYSRDSMIPIRHPYERFGIPSDDEIQMVNPADSLEPDVMPQFSTDEEFAVYLQAQEDRKKERFHRRPRSFFQVPARPIPTSDNNQPPNELVFPGQFRYLPSANDDDDDDDEDNFRARRMHNIQSLFPLFDRSSFGPEGMSPFLLGPRRNHHRTGNLQDTEDDFGPEDYERLLRLDDTVRKKKLSQHQINSIKEVSFHSNVKNTDEENKCGVCLELFEENQTLRQFPCSHVYHKQCADRWLRESNACPICRKPPIDTQFSSSSSSNSRHHHKSSNYHSRRPPPTNRSSSNRQHPTNNGSTTSTHSQSRRGQTSFQRPS